MPHSAQWQRITATMLLACQVPGCTSWRTQSLSPERVIAERRPSAIIVTQAGQGSFRLEAPYIKQDSLIGWDKWAAERVAIPLAEVTEIKVRESDAYKSELVALGVVVGVGVAIFGLIMLALASDD